MFRFVVGIYRSAKYSAAVFPGGWIARFQLPHAFVVLKIHSGTIKAADMAAFSFRVSLY
jgi:hypothetical protein